MSRHLPATSLINALAQTSSSSENEADGHIEHAVVSIDTPVIQHGASQMDTSMMIEKIANLLSAAQEDRLKEVIAAKDAELKQALAAKDEEMKQALAAKDEEIRTALTGRGKTAKPALAPREDRAVREEADARGGQAGAQAIPRQSNVKSSLSRKKRSRRSMKSKSFVVYYLQAK